MLLSSLVGLFAAWYLWRVYTLSYNTSYFPNPDYAKAVWVKRSGRTWALGTCLLILLSLKFGIRGDRIVIAALIGVPVGWLVQHLLIAILVWVRAAIGVVKAKLGITRGPRLAPFVWHYFVNIEEGNTRRERTSENGSRTKRN